MIERKYFLLHNLRASFVLYRFSALLLFILISINLDGQICNGNLGDNIFTAGDFGSGTENIVQIDPQIAPGYTYRSTPPPSDGSYTITNNLAQWANRFDWPAIPSDNSDDPNGYMMVVNASNEPGKFYEQEIDGLCENTLYVFTADVFNIHPVGRNYILPDVSFSINQQVEFGTGPIPEDGQWNTYGFTFTTAPGETTVTLSLSNNAPGGIGNDLILDNISFQACGPEALILPETIANICEDGDPIVLEATINGDQYDNVFIQWQRSLDEGQTWQDILGEDDLTYQHDDLSGGFYYYRYLLAGAAANLQNDKCRVNSNVKIINVIPKFYTVINTLCEGLTFRLGDNEISVSGMYTDTLQNFIGCDSIVMLDLSIVDDDGIDIEFNIVDPSCVDNSDGSIEILNITDGNAPYTIYENEELSIDNGLQTNLEDGTYTYNVIDKYGCEADTMVTLEDPVPFVIDLGRDTTITLGESISIDISSSHPIISYEWSPDNVTDCILDCQSIELTPLQSFTLSLNAISIDDCVAFHSININVEKFRSVFFPNAFTPNQDGVNDLFTIYANAKNVAEIESLIIFDRWGSSLYELNNFQPNRPDLGWDGMYKGKSVNVDTYVYVASIRFIDDEVVNYSGNISVLR